MELWEPILWSCINYLISFLLHSHNRPGIEYEYAIVILTKILLSDIADTNSRQS